MEEYPLIRHQSPTRRASLENLDLGVKRRRYLGQRNTCVLEVRVEKAVHAVRGDGKLPFDPSDDRSVGERGHTLTYTGAKDGDFRTLNSEVPYKQQFLETEEILFKPRR